MKKPIITSTDHLTRVPRALWLLLALGLALRLVYGLAQNHTAVYAQTGGDSWWYLEYGRLLVTSHEPGPPPSGPLYLLFVGLPQHLLAPGAAVMAVRVVQALLSTATAYFGYRLARKISGSQRAGWIAALVLVLSPVFILESAQIVTETLYLFLLVAALWVYIRLIPTPRRPGEDAMDLPVMERTTWMLALAGLLLGLATLTRAVLLAFPLGLALHLVMVYGWRGGLKRALVLLVVYAITVSTWTVYMRARWNLWVVGAQGFSAFLYLGATDWQGPQQVDNSLAQDAGGQFSTEPDEQQQLYQSAAAQIILKDLGGWLSRRGSELAGAFLQPHGVTFFPGESLRDLAMGWLNGDRSYDGFVRLVRGDYFIPKLVIYVLHYISILLGLVGIVRTRGRWRLTLPLIGLLVYTLLIHFALDAIPRYLFPLSFVWWVFAAAALARRYSADDLPIEPPTHTYHV